MLRFVEDRGFAAPSGLGSTRKLPFAWVFGRWVGGGLLRWGWPGVSGGSEAALLLGTAGPAAGEDGLQAALAKLPPSLPPSAALCSPA